MKMISVRELAEKMVKMGKSKSVKTAMANIYSKIDKGMKHEIDSNRIKVSWEWLHEFNENRVETRGRPAKKRG